MRGLVDILFIVTLMLVCAAAILGLLVLVLSLLRHQDVSRKFFSSRRLLPVRVIRFFRMRRYADTADPVLIRLGATVMYLSHASGFFIGITAFLLFFVGFGG